MAEGKMNERRRTDLHEEEIELSGPDSEQDRHM